VKPDVIGLERDLVRTTLFVKPDVIGLERDLVRTTFW
jgi:hypothetical protein